MERHTRRNIGFIAGSIGAFVVACAATALGMIRLINWYLSNCGVGSRRCDAASWVIDYWWLLFVPALLVATALIHRAYVAGKSKASTEGGVTRDVTY